MSVHLIANRNISNESIATSTESLLIDVHHTNYGNITLRLHIIKIIIISKGHHQRCPQTFRGLPSPCRRSGQTHKT